MAVTTFASIDVGSYEVEIVIYEVTSTGIKRIDSVRHLIALGRDTYNDKAISYEMIDELCEVLYDFVNIMKSYQVKNYRAFATSAIREAKNSTIVLDRIKIRTGLKVEVLSNSEQRLVMYEAVASRKEGFEKLSAAGAAMADIGSGSSQVSLFDNGQLVTTQNIKLGTLRVRGLIDKISGGDVSNTNMMEEYIDTDMELLKNLFIKDRKIECLVCVGDNINWLMSRINNSMPKEYYTREEFLEIYHKIYFMGDIGEKLSLSGEQAAGVIPCIMICKKILDVTGANTLWIPGVNLCDGIAVEFAIKEKKNNAFDHDFNADIVAAARNISKRYSWNKEHVKFVEKASLAIFDVMKKQHGLGKRERLLLQIACILHDCGQYISMLHPAQCSYNIIMSTEIIGLSHMEREMVANIVKYTTLVFNEDGELDEVPSDVLVILSKLIAIIKVGNGLDRGHKQKFNNLKFTISGRELSIVTETYEDVTLEKGMLKSEIKFFEEVYGLRPAIIRKKR